MTFKTLPLALVLVLSSCVHFAAPERFLVVEEGTRELRAVTPDDARVWVRVFDDDDNGTRAFWDAALVEDLKNNRGYTVLSQKDVTAKDGTVGTAFLLETTVNGRTINEMMVVFVVPGFCGQTIHTIEYVADKSSFDKDLAAVNAAVSQYKP